MLCHTCNTEIDTPDLLMAVEIHEPHKCRTAFAFVQSAKDPTARYFGSKVCASFYFVQWLEDHIADVDEKRMTQ